MTGSLLPPEPYPESVLTEEQKRGEEHLTKVTNDRASPSMLSRCLFLESPIWHCQGRSGPERRLIVLGSHGRSGISHLLLGSVAESGTTGTVPGIHREAPLPAVRQAA
jgi:hypothetical protein